MKTAAHSDHSYCYAVALCRGLSPDAKVLKVLEDGFEDLDSAKDFALQYAADPVNEKVLGCKSYYCRVMFWKDRDAVGVDYGSYTKFMIAAPMEKTNDD